ncbi:replicative DNA helicase [Bacillus pseudomycoides]|uniref:Replicative DNA helicase n=1 Tax=Bacillus pseudomycoides TaxID=64104 RepID=A0A2A8C4H9_9BACI|nr:replicative DNA helicase [Bacillus pseudomycoides]PEA84737.1 replicative DNA helicase [Bacillus pseudomycoides]PED09087.1 replicative DNA helicase [Bacillus pseudomycoides]PED71552.1 replicative DNA helicase [Bacillus pseudomycoides]PEI40300.1 replicative DNA helicase [Bacillus pseudomycoides]PEI97467.1 replicative DNA helicase [Bacillus pseudomycoides]
MSNDIIRNLEAEQSVLGSIIMEGDLIKDCQLKPNQFSLPTHQAIFKAMRELEDAESPIDLVTVVEKLDSFINQIGGIQILVNLADSVSTTKNFSYHEGLVIEAWKMRHAQEVAGDLYKRLQKDRDISVISNTIDELNAIEETGYSGEFDLKETLVGLYKKMQIDVGDLTGINTGYNDLNRMTSGLQTGDLIIVGARPAMGKTAFVLNVAYHAASSDTAVGIFSLEMGEEQLLKRMISSAGNVDATKMKNPKKLCNIKDWENISQAMGLINNLPLEIYDKANVTIQEIYAKTRKLKRKHPDKKVLIAIDYLQLIVGDPKHRGNRMQEIGEISRKLKLMARELDVCVIALSQLSRAVESRQDKRPLLSDLRETGQIEQDADLIAFLYREDYYDAETANKNITEIILAKQRNGPVGTVELAFIKEFSKFINLERRYDNQQEAR